MKKKKRFLESIKKLFDELEEHNKVLFTLLVALGIILFWKGAWNLMDVVMDQILFGGHIFWSNVAAIIIGLFILECAEVLLNKLA